MSTGKGCETEEEHKAGISLCVALADFKLKGDHTQNTELRMQKQIMHRDINSTRYTSTAPTLQDKLNSLGLFETGIT